MLSLYLLRQFFPGMMKTLLDWQAPSSKNTPASDAKSPPEDKWLYMNKSYVTF